MGDTHTSVSLRRTRKQVAASDFSELGDRAVANVGLRREKNKHALRLLPFYCNAFVRLCQR